MKTRRTFIQQTGLAGAALLLQPVIGCLKPGTTVKNVGIQLYTLREQLVKEVPRVIGKVAGAGYKQVETYGYSVAGKYWGMDPKSFKALLDNFNLVSPSGHYGMDKIITGSGEDDLKAYIDAASVLGQSYIVVPYMAETDRKTIDQYKAIAERLNKAGELCKKSNIQLAYHNHDFEFLDLGGQNGYQTLLEGTDPKLVQFQMDLFWVVRAGADPIKLIDENHGRFPMWHVKDMDKTNHDLNTEIGNGSIDFAAIFEKKDDAGLKYVYLEQENFTIDPYESIEKSYGYIQRNLMNPQPTPRG